MNLGNKNKCSVNGRTSVRFLLPAGGVALVALLILVTKLCALADPAPVLTITPLGSNQFSITVTNATSLTNYTLFWKPVFADTNYAWQVIATNAVGQTNVTVDAGGYPVGFFKILVGIDQDGDGIPEWMDAQPQNPSVGALSVTIDSPTNGTVFN